MPGTHALLSASSSHRWLNCTPSARLEESYAESSSVYAAEGTLAHHYAEVELKHAIAKLKGQAPNEVDYLSELQTIRANELYDPEMDNYVGTYVDYVLEQYNQALRENYVAEIVVEALLDYSEYVPEGFGTGDAIIVANDSIQVIDLKYGKGIAVEVEGNPQFRLYALGAYNQYSMVFNASKVVTTVVQPRLDIIRSETISVDELLKWAEEEVRPKAEKAFAGVGAETIGAHCKFCKHKINCKALKAETNKLAKKAFDKVQPGSMKPKTVADLLVKKDVITDYLKAVGDWALIQARDNGMQIPGFKLVEGRSNRKYLDEAQVADRLASKGLKPDEFYDIKLKGISSMDKVLAKVGLKGVIDDLVVKPEGAPVLVPETDKRQVWQPKQTADEAFKDIKFNGGTENE